VKHAHGITFRNKAIIIFKHTSGICINHEMTHFSSDSMFLNSFDHAPAISLFSVKLWKEQRMVYYWSPQSIYYFQMAKGFINNLDQHTLIG